MRKEAKKKVKVDFTNLEGRMKLTVENKSGNSVDTAIKIMKAFDEVCKDISEGKHLDKPNNEEK